MFIHNGISFSFQVWLLDYHTQQYTGDYLSLLIGILEHFACAFVFLKHRHEPGLDYTIEIPRCGIRTWGFLALYLGIMHAIALYFLLVRYRANFLRHRSKIIVAHATTMLFQQYYCWLQTAILCTLMPLKSPSGLINTLMYHFTLPAIAMRITLAFSIPLELRQIVSFVTFGLLFTMMCPGDVLRNFPRCLAKGSGTVR